MEKIRIVIIDGQPLFRNGIRAVLEHTSNHIIVGESATFSEIEHICLTEHPSVAIIGDLASLSELEVALQIRHVVPAIAFIFLTENEDEEYFFQAIKVGAAAYKHRTITGDELVEMVCKVNCGEYLISDTILTKPQVAARVLQSFRGISDKEEESSHAFSPLSKREIEILDNIAQGKSNKEIAKLLKISDQTVKNHITSILKKLTVTDRTAAVVQALRHGWISIGDKKIAAR